MSNPPFFHALKDYARNLKKHWPLLLVGVALGVCLFAVFRPVMYSMAERDMVQEAVMFEAPGASYPAPASAGADAVPKIRRAEVSAGQGAESEQAAVERLIIRDAQIVLQADETREAQEAIQTLVQRWEGDGAFLVSSHVRGGRDKSAPRIEMQIRVPAKYFPEAIEGITALAAEDTIPDVTQTAADVTEEYVNVTARLDALETARERLRELMSQAATTEALLQAEAQLTQREQEIDALEGRRRFLEESAALSLITVTLEPYRVSQPLPRGWSLPLQVREAVEVLLGSMRGAANFLIFFAIVILPWGVFLLALTLLLRLLVRRARGEASRRDPTATQQEKPASEPDL